MVSTGTGWFGIPVIAMVSFNDTILMPAVQRSETDCGAGIGMVVPQLSMSFGSVMAAGATNTGGVVSTT